MRKSTTVCLAEGAIECGVGEEKCGEGCWVVAGAATALDEEASESKQERCGWRGREGRATLQGEHNWREP